jgi:uncharacterized OsmC-like protein
MTSKVVYQGNLRTTCTHLKSGNQLITDAPLDNHGQGEAFSPTDLLATSLAACMFTIMGIKARDMGEDLRGMEASVNKIMGESPRRVVGIEVNVHFPETYLPNVKTKQVLENAARTCPVFHSLSEEITKSIVFQWNE